MEEILGITSTLYRWYDLYQTGGPEALEDRSPHFVHAAICPKKPDDGQFRRFTVRYGQHADLYRVFLLIAAAIICFRALKPGFC